MNRVRGLLWRLLAQGLRAGAVVFDRLARYASGRSAAYQPQPPANEVGARAYGPPPHWLEHTGRGGPPAHWLAYIAARAPHLLAQSKSSKPVSPEATTGEEEVDNRRVVEAPLAAEATQPAPSRSDAETGRSARAAPVAPGDVSTPSSDRPAPREQPAPRPLRLRPSSRAAATVTPATPLPAPMLPVKSDATPYPPAASRPRPAQPALPPPTPSRRVPTPQPATEESPHPTARPETTAPDTTPRHTTPSRAPAEKVAPTASIAPAQTIEAVTWLSALVSPAAYSATPALPEQAPPGLSFSRHAPVTTTDEQPAALAAPRRAAPPWPHLAPDMPSRPHEPPRPAAPRRAPATAPPGASPSHDRWPHLPELWDGEAQGQPETTAAQWRAWRRRLRLDREQEGRAWSE